ncbi:two-component system sensor histidine kinase RegB [Methylopila capsulata]|uniref:histidine kinase n=1 Tax=Methylopila capsulata TaxID=61654 RepID=A0A9W6MR14_9HYPH|nr:two-component system sensor histidine kinase RegB [Methylopila capsulata]GLK54837.1 ATPase [Methylopila capsulata]
MTLDISHARERLFFVQHRLRLDTLVRLRWLAVAGQSAAVVLVHAALGFPLPLAACFLVIALSAGLNVLLRLRFPVTHRLAPQAAAALLGYDVLQLAALLYLTGGLENPFSVLFLAPVMISATALPPKATLSLAALVVTCATLLGLAHRPLPWSGAEPVDMPFLYVAGIWCALLLALCFIGVYAWRVAAESRELGQALAATELVLAREQHLSALDGLAAAAAHELGTPLATIALVAKELERGMEAGPQRDDIVLLREQVDRCRDILKKLTSLDEHGAPFDIMAMGHLIEDVVEPHRNFGVALQVALIGDRATEPHWRRNPSVLYGLGNIVENAVDFARSSVRVTAGWDAARVTLEIADDGPGFAPEILAKVGEPYVSTRSDDRGHDQEAGGLGLGVFIAKTLLERSGATIEIGNAAAPEEGAVVRVAWPRGRFEAQERGLFG